MKTVELPSKITNTRNAVLWMRSNTEPGDVIVVTRGELERANSAQYGIVPLQPEGRSFTVANPADPTRLWCDDALDVGAPLVRAFAAQNATDGQWYGGNVNGFRITGSNENVENGDYTETLYNQHGVLIDPSKPHADLCIVGDCTISHVWGDGVYGPGIVQDSEVFDVGRHGVSFCQKVLRNRIYRPRRHVFAYETGRYLSNIQISYNIFGGPKTAAERAKNNRAGYFAAPVRGWDFSSNRSTEEDVRNGLIDTTTAWCWALRPILGGYDKRSTDVTVAYNTFDLVDDHIKQGIKTAAVDLRAVDTALVFENTMPCVGPFAKFTNCTEANAWANVGGTKMTKQWEKV